MNSANSSSSRNKRRPPQPGGRQGTGAASKGAPTAPARSNGAGSGLQPVHLLILGTTGAASAAALLAHGTGVPNIVFVVLTVVATGVAAAAVYRTLSPLTSEVATSEPEMVGGRTRAALEREKGIVLRAIKELEFDRAMGKVSEADCGEMIGRLRGRAVRLIRQLDAGSAGYRELIDRELNARLGSANLSR
jgi:hypothetical protein